MKAFYDQSGIFRDDYDPMAVRAKGKGGKAYNDKLSSKRAAVTKQQKPRPAGHLGIPKMNHAPTPTTSQPEPVTTSVTTGSRPIRQRPSEDTASSLLKGEETLNGAVNDVLAKENEELNQEKIALVEENEELKIKMTELEVTVGTLEDAVLETEQERQFYFEKLRNVEVLLQVYQENNNKASQDGETSALMDKIFQILYAVRA